MNHKKIQIARTFRNKFLEIYSKELGDMTKKTIFTPIENIVGSSMKILDKDKIELTLTNAVLLENEIFILFFTGVCIRNTDVSGYSISSCSIL